MKNKTWIIVLVLVILVLGYLFYRSQRPSSFVGYATPTPTATPISSPTPSAGDVLMTKTDPAKGDYLAGPNGMTLYTFDKDTTGVSNCSGACAILWPPYITATIPTPLPANITTLTRPDGTIQFAYNGKPIYYYTPDKQPGDVTGDGVGGVWHLIKP